MKQLLITLAVLVACYFIYLWLKDDDNQHPNA